MSTTPLTQSVRLRGGLAATYELLQDGHTRRDIAAAVAARTVVRVRQGWFASRDIHPAIHQAARVGGRLGCVSALALHGVWVPGVDELHVTVAAHACRLRTPRDMRKRIAELPDPRLRVHWRTAAVGTRLMLSPVSAMVDVLDCQPVDFVAAIGDSLLLNHPGLWGAWRELLSERPPADQLWLTCVDGVCESGSESLVWFRLRLYSLPIRRQVSIVGVGRVDFLIGERLVIEVDGAAYHTDPERFEADRHRDAALSRRGFRVLRFSYRQVLDRWPEVEQAILAAVIRGDHNRA